MIWKMTYYRSSYADKLHIFSNKWTIIEKSTMLLAPSMNKIGKIPTLWNAWYWSREVSIGTGMEPGSKISIMNTSNCYITRLYIVVQCCTLLYKFVHDFTRMYIVYMAVQVRTLLYKVVYYSTMSYMVIQGCTKLYMVVQDHQMFLIQPINLLIFGKIQIILPCK